MRNNRLCLGTTQFGLVYGINNQRGKPTKREVFAMLDKAVDLGIEFIDTAVAYGDAEELLGEYGVKQKQLRVISKLRPNLISDDCPNPEEIVENEIKGSLKRLRLDVLEGYLLHTPENFYNEGIMNGLRICKEKGLIRNLGVSIYEVQHALDSVSTGLIDYIQIPYSVFDQRMDGAGFFELARKNDVKVFARSAFLQGLIFMEEERIPEYLSVAKGYLQKFDEIIQKHGLTRGQAALLFTYFHPGVDYVVFGVDDIEQLVEDVAISRSNIDFRACREELIGSFANIEKSIIFPSLWARKRPVNEVGSL